MVKNYCRCSYIRITLQGRLKCLFMAVGSSENEKECVFIKAIHCKKYHCKFCFCYLDLTAFSDINREFSKADLKTVALN